MLLVLQLLLTVVLIRLLSKLVIVMLQLMYLEHVLTELIVVRKWFVHAGKYGVVIQEITVMEQELVLQTLGVVVVRGYNRKYVIPKPTIAHIILVQMVVRQVARPATISSILKI